MTSEQVPQPEPSGTGDPDEAVLNGYWAQIEANVQDEAHHKRFIAYAVGKERYLFAIERYKDLGKRRPEHLALAQQQEKRVVAQVTAKIMSGGPKQEERSPLEPFTWFFVIAGLSAIAYPHFAALQGGSMYSRKLWWLLVPGFFSIVIGLVLVQKKRARELGEKSHSRLGSFFGS